MENIELKIKINSFNEIEKAAKEMGANFKEELLQVDTYYNSPQGRFKIREINQKESQMIFYQRPNLAKSKISNYKINKIKKSKLNFFKNIFSSYLGLKIVVKKNRHLWIYKNTRIHLDKVNQLGDFLELETVVNQGVKKARQEFAEVVKFLNLEKYPKCKMSYSDMLLDKN